MTLKEQIQRKIEMVEYHLQTNCNKEEFMEKFKTRDNNFFYSTRAISRSEKKINELKDKLEQPRKPYNQWKEQCNSDEVQEWLKVGIKEMLNRGKSSKEISKIFNRKINDIEMLIGEIDELIKDRNELAKVSKEIKEHKNPKTNRDYRKG